MTVKAIGHGTSRSVKGEDGADIVKVVKGGPSGKGFKSTKTRSVGVGGDDLNLGFMSGR